MKPNLPQPAAARKTTRTCLAALKSAGGFFFSFPSETIRPGAVKGLETDPKREHKANLNNWETDKFHFAISENLHVIVCLYYYYYFIIFTSFISIFYFSFFCLVFFILFVCLIALFDWFSLFSLSWCILIFLLLLHLCSNNTLL